MKNIKSILALVLVCIMMLPLNLFALEADTVITDNWNSMAAKYSKGTWNLIAPKADDYAIKTEGFTFSESDRGGIKVVTPDYETFAGTYAVSAVTSKATTKLDGLSVVITADEFDSLIDNIGTGNTIGILWSEEKIEGIAGFNEEASDYDKGLYTAVRTYDSGLRNLIPTVEGATEKTPASDPKATPNGQALYISATIHKEAENAAPVVNAVKIAWYDGYYINDDGNPGYRWSFTARNNLNTSNSDATRLSRDWEYVDLSDGLAVSIRADEEHGFIVTVNGYDYYRGEDVGYFPDAKPNWYGYKTGDLTDDRIEEKDPYYIDTMTYERKDVDLRGLTTAGEGYLTIGATSNNDQYLNIENGKAVDHHCNYTVDYINGIPAAQWNGEAMSDEHECEMTSLGTKAPTCLREGADVSMCKVCGKYEFTNTVPATGHDEGEYMTIEMPTCDNHGTKCSRCSKCKSMVRSEAIPKVPHTYNDEWTVTLEPTCTTDGKKSIACSVCPQITEEIIPASPDKHVVNWQPVIETVDGSTDWRGKETGVCSACGKSVERMADMTEYIRHFADVKPNAWYMSEVAYCVKQGYVSGMTETTFVPNGNLTRAQFMTLLAKLDGVDLSVYDGKDSGFADVKPSHWYNKVVCWAVENKITSGISETKFGPNNDVTRSQLARFFYVYTEKVGGDVTGAADISGYPDAAKVQGWAKTPVEWAVDAGLISGVKKGDQNLLDPNGKASRAQAARMIMVYTQLGECEHEWGEWVVTIEPTIEAEGEQQKTCALCGETETMPIPPVVQSFSLVFDSDGDISTTEDIIRTVSIQNGESYAEAVGELPEAEKEGFKLKGWFNSEYRIVITADKYASLTFDLSGNIEDPICFVPVWESEGEKTGSFTFINENVEGFEPIVYRFNKDDSFIGIFMGEYPDPEKYDLDEFSIFVGWQLEELGIILTEDQIWESNPLGYLSLDGDWVFTALYEEA